MQFAGVITGDIVGSTKLDEASRRATLATLEGVFSSFKETITGEIYRGDAFQIYTERPEMLLHVALACVFVFLAKNHHQMPGCLCLLQKRLRENYLSGNQITARLLCFQDAISIRWPVKGWYSVQMNPR